MLEFRLSSQIGIFFVVKTTLSFHFLSFDCCIRTVCMIYRLLCNTIFVSIGYIGHAFERYILLLYTERYDVIPFIQSLLYQIILPVI